MLPKSLILGFAGATAVSAACTGPAANAATVDLVKGFETFQPDICASLYRLSQTASSLTRSRR